MNLVQYALIRPRSRTLAKRTEFDCFLAPRGKTAEYAVKDTSVNNTTETRSHEPCLFFRGEVGGPNGQWR